MVSIIEGGFALYDYSTGLFIIFSLMGRYVALEKKFKL